MSNTEGLSVAAVKTAIGLATNRLKPVIDENDRTQITDGHIELYAEVNEHKRSSQQSNEAWTGRVPVQVRGRTYRRPSEGRGPYKLSKRELVNYRELGGVLFFHVAWAGKKCEIRYAALTPFKIDRLIELNLGNSKIEVRTLQFPDDADGMIRLLHRMWRAQDEARALDYNAAALGEIESFQIFTDRPLDTSTPFSFDAAENDMTILITTDRGVTLPANLLGTLAPMQYVGEEWEIEVKSGDVVFERPIRRQVDSRIIELRLSKGITLTMAPEGDVIKGDFRVGQHFNLPGRIKDLEFCRAIAEEGGFNIGAQRVGVSEAPEIAESTKSELATLIRFRNVLEKLGAEASLVELDRVTNAEMDAFSYLHGVIFEGDPLQDPFRQTGRVRQPVGGWALELLVVPGRESGEWNVLGIKEAGDTHSFAADILEDGERGLVTVYDVLDQEIIEQTINLDLGSIRDAYDRIKGYDYMHSLAINCALKLIGASDSVSERRQEFLTAARELLEWIHERFPDDPACVVNLMQIKVRDESLDGEDRAVLREIRSGPVDDRGVGAPVLRACCSVLLGEIEECQFWLDQMDDSTRKQFFGWPIAKLMVGLTNADDVSLFDKD